MEAVYNLSIEESLLNINDGLYGKVFWTGTNWHKVWTKRYCDVRTIFAGVDISGRDKNSILEKNCRRNRKSRGYGKRIPEQEVLIRIPWIILSWKLPDLNCIQDNRR